MSLFRLDYFDPETGETQEAVRQPVIGGDFLSRHMTTARSHATTHAAETQRAILVTRIAGAGRMRASLVIHPDGSATRPPGSEGEACRAGSGRACFCRNCRAGRRER